MPVELVTIPHVHLASTGRWDTSTGVWEPTTATFAAIIQAQDDPGIRTPIIKLGHADRKSGLEVPAVGRIENLSVENDGADLYGDLVGVPKWLGEIIASAYPDRSVEVVMGYTGATGHKHDAVLTGLALLGVSTPAIESLEDVRDLYQGEYEELVAATAAAGGKPVVATFAADPASVAFHKLRAHAAKPTKKVKASVSMDFVRSEFYERLPSGSWTWIREIWSDFLIVDDDEGELYQIPWSEGSDGTVDFSTPVPVKVQYVPSTEEEAEDAAEPAMIMLGRFHNDDPQLIAASKPEGGQPMPNADLVARLGLPEDATQEQVDAAIIAKLDTTPVPETVVPATLPEGAVVMDEAQVGELVSAAKRGDEAFKMLADQARDRVLDGAIKAGKFPPARREHYVSMWEKDPEGTKSYVETVLAAGLIPVEAATGHAGDMEGEDAAVGAQIDAHFAALAGQEVTQ